MYNQHYESAAAFWPHVHSRIIASLVISQLLLMGLLSTKKAANSTPFLVVLPILTLSFHKYCKYRFEPAFREYPLEVILGLLINFLIHCIQFFKVMYSCFQTFHCHTFGVACWKGCFPQHLVYTVPGYYSHPPYFLTPHKIL